MNPDLDRLQPYPFQKLAALFREVQPAQGHRAINMHIGEPKHATPQFIREALSANLAGLANYPTTAGSDTLRGSIADWLQRRYGLPALDAVTQVLPVNGSREALFAFAQAVINRKRDQPVVVSPNPFYQIYEGAALLAGATPHFLNTLPQDNFALDFEQLDESTWQRTQLIYVCSPGNPSGHVMDLSEWKTLFEMSDRYGFVIAADECYSEIYFDAPSEGRAGALRSGDVTPEMDAATASNELGTSMLVRGSLPLGAMQAAHLLGRSDYRNLVAFSSLSKRSNVPGMRSGFVAGDAQILGKFALYRTYHGCAMNPAVQAASAAAWRDEEHVAENRRLYAEKFSQAAAILKPVLPVKLPDAAFYLWLHVPIADTRFAQQLYRDYNVTVLPGSFLAREAHGVNPGENFVRIALVAELAETIEAMRRIAEFTRNLT